MVRPTASRVLAELDELERALPGPMTAYWPRVRETVRTLASSRPEEARMHLRWAERAFAPHMAPPSTASSAGDVGGVIFEHSTIELGEFMDETDLQIEAFDRDVMASNMPSSWFGSWVAFTDGPVVYGKTGWRAWYKNNKWVWQRFWSTADIWKSCEAYDAEFRKLYDQAKVVGVETSLPEPVVGPDTPPAKPFSAEDVRAAAAGLLTLGVILGVAWGISEFRKARA